ncbi:MAG: galactose mutarotase [Treponema sp.]|nr:galactose mutarotase [Treponema sp.]
MKISKEVFGVLSNGRKVHLYTLKAGDLRLCLSSFGATWASLIVPSSKGGKSDVLLGFSGLDGYMNNSAYIGVTVGRFANRIGGARFTLDGDDYRLEANEGENTLHGGYRGFDKMLWKSEAYEESDGVFVRFELNSDDGDGGFPGNLRARVTYGITKSNEVIAIYEARSDAPTPINLTNHAYFNLAGEGSPSVLSHELLLNSSSYLEVDSQSIPTGRLIPVRGSPFDFRESKPIKRDMKAEFGGSGGASAPEGYDHCFTVDGDLGKLRSCAEVREFESGRTMRVLTTQPSVQFYTGNMLPDVKGKAGAVYSRHSGFCLETQHFPDSPNREDFPPCIFGPDNPYAEKSVFAFEIE